MPDARVHISNCNCDYDVDINGYFRCYTDPRCRSKWDKEDEDARSDQNPV